MKQHHQPRHTKFKSKPFYHFYYELRPSQRAKHLFSPASKIFFLLIFCFILAPLLLLASIVFLAHCFPSYRPLLSPSFFLYYFSSGKNPVGLARSSPEAHFSILGLETKTEIYYNIAGGSTTNRDRAANCGYVFGDEEACGDRSEEEKEDALANSGPSSPEEMEGFISNFFAEQQKDGHLLGISICSLLLSLLPSLYFPSKLTRTVKKNKQQIHKQPTNANQFQYRNKFFLLLSFSQRHGVSLYKR